MANYLYFEGTDPNGNIAVSGYIHAEDLERVAWRLSGDLIQVTSKPVDEIPADAQLFVEPQDQAPAAE